MKYDVIVPIFYINEHFERNVASWIKTIPINKIWFGVANPLNITFMEGFLSGDVKYEMEMIDQTKYDTLGYCLKKLMSHVETDWFVYLHDDVRLPEHWFDSMMAFMDEVMCDVGESVKDLTTPERKNQYDASRAYSGAQIIRSSLIRLLDDYDDDFIYTSEDLIFQHRLRAEGYIYSKIPVFHEHQGHDVERSVSRETVLEWQMKALVKYLPLDDYTLNLFSGTIQALKREMIERWSEK